MLRGTLSRFAERPRCPGECPGAHRDWYKKDPETFEEIQSSVVEDFFDKVAINEFVSF